MHAFQRVQWWIWQHCKMPGCVHVWQMATKYITSSQINPTFSSKSNASPKIQNFGTVFFFAAAPICPPPTPRTKSPLMMKYYGASPCSGVRIEICCVWQLLFVLRIYSLPNGSDTVRRICMREQRRMSADDVIDGRDVVLSRCAQRSARCPPYLRPRHAYLHLYPGVRHVVAIDRGGRRISHRRVIFVVC